jgi:hypothetical protein
LLAVAGVDGMNEFPLEDIGPRSADERQQADRQYDQQP